jgi:ferrous iron transport protein B
MWEKATQYLRKMGTVILFASVLIWAASYFPTQTEYSRDYDGEITAIKNDSNISSDVKDSIITRIEIARMAERHENSYMGRIGHAIEPVIAPLGFNWQVGCALLTGFAAKEVVVSTLAVLVHSPEEDLATSLRELKYTQGAKEGEKVFSPLIALSLMVFILLYFPCTATITAIGREAGWRWAVFSAVYTTTLAYILSLVIYQAGSLLL